MTSGVERSYQRTVRVMAPMRRLYQEMSTAEEVIRFMPQVERYKPTDDPAQVQVQTSISIGPLPWPVEGTLRVDPGQPPALAGTDPSELRLNLVIPSLQTELDGVLELVASAAEETQLTFSATIRSTHPLFRRMRGQLTGALEEQVDITTDRIAMLVRQHADAERRLAGLRDDRERA